MPQGSRQSVRVEASSVGMMRYRTAWVLAWSGILGLLIGYPLARSLTEGIPHLSGVGEAIWIVPLILLGLALRNVVPRLSSGSAVCIEDEQIVLERADGRRETFPLAKVVSGMVVPLSTGADVHFVLRSGDVVVATMGSERDAEALLEASGLDPMQHRVDLRLRRIFHQCLFWLVGVPFTSLFGLLAAATVGRSLGIAPGGVSALTGLAAAALVLGVIWGRFMGPNVSIGSDGVGVRYGFGRRFLAYRDIDSVLQLDMQIIVVMRDGRLERIWAHHDRGPELAAIVHRIREAHRKAQSRASAQGNALARGDRSLGEWRAALASLVRRTASYREVAIDRKDIVRVLEDPGAPAEHRIGAALALSESGDAEGVERVRIAAAASASEPVRVALERVARGEIDEATVERAVARRQAP